MVEAEGRLPSTDEPGGCLECDGVSGGLWDISSSSSGTVRRSLSAPHPSSLDAISSPSCDSQSRFHCDLVAQNGSDVYRYPSPLHAVAVQSPGFLQMLGPDRDDGPLRSGEAGVEPLKPESLPASVSAPLVSQSSEPSSSSSQKRLDSYIFSLLQRRALPVRTGRPRTSISTDPSKSVLRQAGLCVRQLSGPGLGTLGGSEFKPSRSSGAEGATPEDLKELGSPKANFSSKESSFFPHQELIKSPPLIRTFCAAARSPKPLQTVPTEKGDRSVPESASLGSSSRSQEGEGAVSHMGAVYAPGQRQSSNVATTTKASRVSERSEASERRVDKSCHRSGSKKSRRLEDVKVSKRAAGCSGGAHGASSRIKRLPASIPEGRVLDKNTTWTPGIARPGVCRHHHHHGRDPVVVVAKPKYKRSDYRRLRAFMEVQYDEAFRRAQRRQRKELLSPSADAFLPAAAKQASSPYTYVAGSDSEYSAECASLFHSTIADTSEDERSNYTTNRFGDSESSKEEFVEESSAASDTEESRGGGSRAASWGRGQPALAGAGRAGREVTPAQVKAFVKIKASHNLKKKILRFRSGSLKLMTTV
ncbi:dapper homolog 1 isoform X2 [Centropristis striata]|nr:dapper homolog 1 isoform X2 [Centropristis striata]